MEAKPLSLRTAQATALFLSAAASGLSLSLSTLVVPRLLESPTPLMLQQWARSFHRSRWMVVSVTESAAAAYLYLSYRGGLHRATTGRLYLAAVALCLGIVPYTAVAVMPINRKLFQRLEETKDLALTDEVDEVGIAKEEGSKYLVDQWGLMNLGRTVLITAASVVGLVASL